MPRTILSLVACGVAALGFATAAAAASRADFDQAFAAATMAEQQAGALRNQWTPTEAALKAAQKAAGEKNYDEAVQLARHAEALAQASIVQAREQDKEWRGAVIK